MSWAVKPITRSSAGSLGDPSVSYSTSMVSGFAVATVARGIGRSLPDRTTFRRDDETENPAMTRFGVHTGLQHTTADEMRLLCKRIQSLRFDWISIWDHFYGATGDPADAACLEAVAMHAALACETDRVQCGALVYSIGYRHPAVLAKAITAIDLISGGRAAMGIGAGWAEVEYRAYGIDFPPIGTRMDQLEEGVAILRGLLHDEETTFEGRWFRVNAARNEPRPIQAKLPIWVGGGGEKRTLRIAARFADGWNVPFASPETFAAKRDVLHRHCAD